MPYKDPNDPRLLASRRRHYYKNKEQYLENNKKRRLRNQIFLIEYLEMNPCVDCGESDIRCLQFDHRNATEKTFNIGKAVTDGLSIKAIQADIDKCDVRCANCHAKRTSAQFGWFKESYGVSVTVARLAPTQ